MATKTIQAAEAAVPAAVQAVVQSSKPMFQRKFGNKQIFLPNFTLTMIRNNKLPPTFASFIVPLNLNKLDLRDYLWHAYGVPVIGVRSYIQQQKLRQDKPGAKRIAPRRWFRPRSIKKMTVEMERPFTWPAEPSAEELEKWDKTMFDAGSKDQREREEGFQRGSRERPSKERGIIKEQAKEFLSGKVKWSTAAEPDAWEDVGEAREVETDIEVPEFKSRE